MYKTDYEHFLTLNGINVNEHTETKETGNSKLTYLSWAWAWAEVKKRYPNAKYEIVKFNGLPYVFDEKAGYMVYTTVTIEDITHEMWLPVMDGANKAMLDRPYTYKTKFGEKTVEPATMFDINKTIMRCLTKNLAMFGLGLYIYAGEDLPESEQDGEKHAQQPTKGTQQANAPSRQENSPQAKQTAQMTLKQALAFTAKGGKFGGWAYRDISTSHLEWRAENMTGEAQEAAKLVLAFRSGKGDTSVIDSLPQISDDDMPF